MTLASLFLDNWRELTATLSAVFLFFAGRKSTKLQEKKQTVDAVVLGVSKLFGVTEENLKN